MAVVSDLFAFVVDTTLSLSAVLHHVCQAKPGTRLRPVVVGYDGDRRDVPGPRPEP
jgi:hypothetical protein